MSSFSPLQKNLPRDVENSSSTGKAFQPFGKILLTGKQNSDEKEGGNSSQKVRKPELEIVEEEGVVKRIIVTCSCGERIVLECSYAD